MSIAGRSSIRTALKAARSPASWRGAGSFITRPMDQSMMDATKREREFLPARLGEAQVVYFDQSKSHVCSFYPAGTRRGCR
jgi:hypothetical protein